MSIKLPKRQEKLKEELISRTYRLPVKMVEFLQKYATRAKMTKTEVIVNLLDQLEEAVMGSPGDLEV